MKDLLNYDPETGDIFWSVNRGKVRQGDPAGSIMGAGYLQIGVGGRKYYAHRIAWYLHYGEWPGEIDHINRIRTDNRIVNLREVTRQVNTRNRSNVAGVCWDKQHKKWRAHIGMNNKLVTLGVFAEWWDAICARKSAEAMLW